MTLKKEIQEVGLERNENFFVTKKGVINICNRLKNIQDKILIYSVYNGISGYKLEELRNLKYSDYDSVNSIIKIGRRDVKVDWYFAELLEEAKNEKRYYVQNGKSANGVYDSFKINTDSEYILRGKPTVKNDNGLKQIGYTSIHSRLNIISEFIGESLTTTKLHRSKVVEDMIRVKKEWKYSEVQRYLVENELKFNTNNIIQKINEVSEKVLLLDEVEKIADLTIDTIKTEKLTVYQKESIGGLYKIVAGLELINETQKRKVNLTHYKVNAKSPKNENLNRKYKDQLIDVDTMYWEFIVNREFALVEDEYLIKVYANKEEYNRANERYYVSYINGLYTIFPNVEYVGPGERNDLSCSWYSSSDCINVLNWMVDDFNEINKEERKFVLQNMPYKKEVLDKFTPIFTNDMGLDLIFAIKDFIRFEVLNLNFGICDELEKLTDIKQAIPCIDVSTLGESYILVTLSDNRNVIVQAKNRNEFRLYESIGMFGRYKKCSSLNEMIINLLGEDSLGDTPECSAQTEIKMKAVIRKINEVNKKIDSQCDEFVKMNKEDYIYYSVEGKSEEIVVYMYDCNLTIMYNLVEDAYIIKKRLELSGLPLRIYEVYKTRDVEDLCKWILMVKVSSIENMEYDNF